MPQHADTGASLRPPTTPTPESGENQEILWSRTIRYKYEENRITALVTKHANMQYSKKATRAISRYHGRIKLLD